MAKRISKKLLFGLGSSLTFGTIGTVAGFGIKSIINQVNNDLGIANLAINALQETTFDNAPNYNKAEQSMFINTANLKSFHFGNTQKGQTVTPYGWLGVFEDSAVKKNRIALTSWGGEILWVNEDYGNENNDTYNVYDMKYDFNTDLIFVVRTPSNNGMFMDNGDIAPLQMDVLNARTGQRVYDQFNAGYFRNLQTSAKARMEQIFLDNSGSWATNRDRLESLYYLDIASKKGTNEVLISYIPKFTQLVQRKRLKGNVNASDGEPAKGSAFITNDKSIKLVSVKEFVDSWHKMAISIRYDRSIGHWTKNYKLRKAAKSIDDSNADWQVRANIAGDSLRGVSMEDYFLLINPFFTISSNNNFIFHFVAAKGDGSEVIHKMITFRRDGSSDGTGNNGIVNGSDKTQYVGAKSIYSFQLSSLNDYKGTWGFADRWSNLISNANLLPNKNMFDNNSIVTAYPYASDLGARAGKGLPLFSVQQILVNPDENGGGKFYDAVAPNVFEQNAKNTFNYNFGESIINYYRRNSANYGRPNINNIYPWPTANILGSSDINASNIDHFYNRLISVSPFDNTIVYAAKPNVKNPNFDMNTRNTDKAVTFWIGSRNKTTMEMNSLFGPRVLRPFIVTNWTDNGNQLAPIDTWMTNYKSLYRDGITFDIFSTIADKDKRTHLNLYFNNTGSGRNDIYNDNRMPTSKIGLLDDVLADDPNFWTQTVTDLYSTTISGVNPNQYIKKINSKLNRQSYSTLIHSRANLSTWFARTWQNNTSAANMYAEGFRLNGEESVSKRAEAKTFGNKLSNQGTLLSSKESVDLVSHWEDKASNTSAADKTPPNYSRLAIKRPKISVKGSKERTLPVEISYVLANNGTDFFTKPDWGFDRDNENLVIFKKTQDITNASYEILTSLGKTNNQHVINAIGNKTSALNIGSEDLVTPIWVDARKITNPNQAKFGFVNNNVAINNQKPLRLMVKIVKPGGTLPSWFNQIDSNIFSRAYPVQKVGNETSIGEVLTELAKQKAQRIKFTDAGTDNTAVGFGNLKLEAYLGLNPAFVNSGDKLYTNGSTTKLLVDQTTDQSVIYNDRFETLGQGNRTIYDQSSIQYSTFNGGGFKTVNELLWKNGTLDRNNKLNVSVDYSLIPDTLVRERAGSNDPIFDFSYKSGTNNILELRPKNPDWFRKTFTNLNRMTNLFMLFQFRTDSDSEWKNLVPTEGTDGSRSFYYDNEAAQAFANNVFTIKTSIPNITKLRIKLTPKRSDGVVNDDHNHFVDIQNYQPSTDNSSIDLNPTNKYISASHSIALQAIEVDKNWILNNTLANQSNSLANISATDINNYETQVLNSITDATKRAAVKLVYSFKGGNFDLDAQGLATALTNAFNDFTDSNQGVFALWNGTNGSKLIRAKFALKANDGKYKLTVRGNENPNETDLSGDVKSTIKSKIDLGDYINQLTSAKLNATGDVNGTLQGNTISFPNKTGAGRFENKSFNEIKAILQNVGVAIKFKRQAQNGTWSGWLENQSDINTYQTSDPKFKIGFIFSGNYNIELLNGSNVIANNQEYEIRLNLPKVIKLPAAADIPNIINQFKAQNVFTGDTKNLVVNNFDAAKKIITDALISASGGGTAFDPIKAGLILHFKLANSPWDEANNLKTWLAQQANDIDNNGIKMKVVLPQNLTTEFMLDPALAQYEFEILQDNNPTVKKYINGTTWENSLRNNGISLNAGSSKQNLTYTFSNDLNDFKTNGEITNKEVTLEYQLVTAANANPAWQQGQLPSSVNADVNQIKIRIANKSTVTEANKIYTYGPQKLDNRQVLTIDLQNIPTILNIDPTWFNQNPITNTPLNDLANLTADVIKKWEKTIWAKVNNNAGVPQDLQDKVYIKYTLEIGNGGHENLEADTLTNALLIEKRNYTNSQHHGIFKLWNSTDGKGYKIKATFAKRPGNEQKIQFQKNNQNVDNDETARTSYVNTDNVRTTLDLSAWIGNLIANPTTINTNTAGVIPANGLVPPVLAGAANSNLFATQTFANIDGWLKTAGVNLLWNKDPSVSTNIWNSTTATNAYDPTKKKLWFAIENQSSNLILTLGNSKPTLNIGENNKTNSIEIKLNAPAVIDVNPDQLMAIQPHFSGDTKRLTVNQTAITNELNKIKKALGAGFENAPLTIMVTVGDKGPYDYKNVAAELAKLNDDLPKSNVQVKFAIDPTAAANNNQFQIKPGGDVNKEIIPDNGTIKIYINNKNIFEDLSATEVQGTSKAMKLIWKNGITIDDSTGVLTAAGRGKGLRIEYTFKADLTGNESDPNNDDPTQGWSKRRPTSFRSGIDNKLFMRIRLADPNKYLYEKINQKITIDLSKLKSIITIDGTWLNKPVAPNEIDLASFGNTQIQEYETKVLAATNITASLKDKIEIRYDFNGQTNLTKDKLIQLIQNYKANNTNSKNNLGILQLANGTESATGDNFSEKIIAKFAVKDQFSSLYELEIKQGTTNSYQLDTSKVITTIDFTNVLSWLQSLKVPFNQNRVEIPAVSAGNNEQYFNNQQWTKVEQTLKGFGITIEYRKVMNSTQGPEENWSDQISSINGYNPAIGKFQVRFKVDGTKSKNIKFKTASNETLVGSNPAVKSKAYDVNLQVKLMVQIDQQYINAFKSTPNVVSGNTKYLNILDTAETQMINNIKTANQANNPAFSSLNLKVEYKLGDPTGTGDWKNRTDFINLLKGATNDQTTNKVIFRFVIDASQNSQFGVDQNNNYVLSDKQNVTESDIKIKYFVHTDQRETKADNVIVSGDQNNLSWNFSSFGTANTNFVEQNQQVFLRSTAGNLLRLEFTTKTNPNYADAPASDNVSEISTKWVTKKPITIKVEDREKLYIRIKPAFAAVDYEAGYSANGVNPTTAATVHKVITQIQSKINIDKAWLNQVSITANEIEIKQFNETLLNNWITQLRAKIKTVNGLTDDTLVNKIDLEFSFDSQTGLTATTLVKAINDRLANSSSAELGIFQLWNPTLNKGIKINAKFKTSDPGILLNPTNNGSLADDLNTQKVYTLVDFRTYEQVLKTSQTAVSPKANAGINDISSFSPPNPNGNWNGKTYDDVINRLSAVGITVKYAKEANGPWVPRDQITSYNPKTRKLFLAFSNQANNNLRLKLETTEVTAGQQDVGAIGLPLAVPKQINIKADDLANWQASLQFRGDTKNIEYQEAAVQTVISKILQRNAQENNDQSFNNAPLKVKFKVGDTGEWKPLDGADSLKAFLKKYPDDLTDREIKYQFYLDGANPNEWIFEPQPNMLEGTVVPDNNSSPLKIYINDKSIFSDLGQPDLTGSTSANLQINWNAKKISVDPKTGVLNAKEVANANNPRGVGLRVEFTYKTEFTGAANEAVNDDPFKGWSKITPTSFNPNIAKQLLIRIKLTDEAKYKYDQVDRKITIDLSNLPTIINLDANWLNQVIVNQKTPIEQLSKTQFEAYESKVWAAANLGQADRPNVAIEYTFDNKQYRDLEQLVKDIKSFKDRHTSDVGLGILQLWNGNSGVTITTKFVKKEANGNYNLVITGNNNHSLDFVNVVSTIDLTKVVTWLESIKVENKLNAAVTNGISSITIPNVSAANDPYFNNRQWTQVEQALASFGIQVQYRPALNGQDAEAAWGDTTAAVNKYDPNIGKFEIRFKFDGTKSKNIKIKINTDEWEGTQANSKTKTIQVKLKIKLVVKLDQTIIDKFTSAADAVTGNTKQLTIKKDLANQIINEIKQQNSAINNEFNNVNLKITYKIGDGNDNEQWLEADAFQTKLLNAPNDQATNQIVFRFEIDQSQNGDFSVDNAVKVLSAKEAPTAATKIKYFINKSNWEAKADKLVLRGTSSNLTWDFNSAFGAGNVKVENDQTVYLINPVGNAMQLQFTTKANAAYTDGTDQVSNNVTDLNTKWVTKHPTSLAASVTALKVRIVPLAGFIYEPATLNNNEKAKVHDVDLQIQTEIKVDKTWFKASPLVDTGLDISALTAAMIQSWEAKIYEKIKTTNGVSDQVAKEIKIKYILEGETTKYSAADLITKISQLRTEYNNSDLGILQLWNTASAKGKKVHAIFESPNNKYILKVDNVTGTPTENDLKDQVNTDNIYTTISMIKYIQTLTTDKTDVELDPSAEAGKITSFTPPAGKNNGEIFFQKTYQEIANRLQAVGVKIEFSKDKTNWSPKEQIKEYDIQKNSLYLRFTVEAQNIRLQLNITTQIGPNQNSEKTEIRLPLAVPKYIVVDINKPYWSLIQQFNFSGTTKAIEFDKTKIDKFVTDIKSQNATDGADPEYNNAPLEIQFQVGTGSEFVEISKLKNYLKNHQQDMPDRQVRFRLALKPGTDEKLWKIKNGGDYTLLRDDEAKNTIKIYINDQGVYQQLTTMRITGSNDALVWNWPELVKPPVLDEQTGILNPDAVANKDFGKGLKFEYTFNKNHGSAASGSDSETQWVASLPKSYNANKGFTNVYLRIKLTDSNRYVYDHADQTITLSLDQVGQKLVLKAAWLAKQFNNGTDLNLETLTAQKISEYEQQVKATAQAEGIDATLLGKFTIKYQFNFNSQIDETKLVDAAGLVKAIEQYQSAKENVPFGILQLWNQSAGIKIVAKFVDAIQDDKYQIEVKENPDYQVIDTSNIITTIDFTKVITWLTTTKKLVQVIGSNPNVTFKIPAVSAADDQTFNGKEWSKVSQTLKQMGITVQYREVLQANLPAEQGWVEDLNQVKQYEEKIGKIQVRFKFDNAKAKNIKFKTDSSQTHDGKTATTTNPFDLSLNIKLTLQINEKIVSDNFVSKQDVISGNTKYLSIKKSYQDEMIKLLIKDNEVNNSAFNQSGLTVQFKLDQQRDDEWKNLEQFIQALKSSTQDQRSNKVLFRFIVTNTEDFQVDGKSRVLFDPANQNPADWKVKLFINNGNWEAQAANVEVGGKTSALRWNWNGMPITENNNKVEATGLQIEFSAKNGANYNDSAAVETGDLKTQWILQKPTTLDPTIKTLYIRIKAKAGYVYGPAYTDPTNGVTANAKAHPVHLNIKREIVVNPKALLRSLSMGGTEAFVNNITKDILDNFVEEGLNQIAEPSLRQYVTVKFNFNNKKALDSTALLKEIKAIIESNDPSDYGILQLWNGTQGTKIDAYYDLVDPNGEYELITTDSTNPKEPQTVVTGHIKTKIDLMNIINDFKSQKIEFEPADNNKVRNLITIKKWKMPQTKSGANALHGISWDAFEKRLNDVGVAIKARIVNNPDTTQDWKPLSELKQYNDSTLQLAFRFEIDNQKGDNIVLSVNADADVDSTKPNSPEFKMSIKAPARVNVSESLLNTFKTSYQIGGDTKNIQLDQNAETTLINAIATENIAINPDVFKDLKSRLSVEYYLGKTPTDSNSQWSKREEFIQWLSNQNTDQTTNEVWFRLAVTNPTGDDEAQTFNIDATPKQLSAHQIDANAKIKIFINDNGLENRAKTTLKATGSTEAVTISGWDSFKNSMPDGLKAQWSNKATPNETNDDDWTEEPPTTLDANKSLWIRFKSEAGYVYEKAIKDANNNNNYTQYSAKQAISTDGLKVILKVKKEWLKKVTISNNTSNPQINEDGIKNDLQPILPIGKDGLIELKYRIKGTNDWLLKDAFISKLKGLNGAKDATNFILKREEIEIRYAIKQGEDEYALNIDGQNVDNTNEANFYLQLINDKEQLNENFEGYINVNLVKDFKKENFKIQGSTTKPSFIITNRQQLETALMPYAGKHLFDIQYSTQYKDGNWTWNNDQSILNDDGTLISETGLINKVQIGPDKKFALRFISKNNKYSVYQGGNKQDNGYILDLSDNVKITIEITNPFTAANKTLGVWTREGKQAKYYQSEGGFKIVVANKADFEVENKDQPKSAQQFLKESSLAQNEKDALEFVYHVFGSNPTQAEIDQIQKTINDHGSKDWTSFNKKATKSDTEWTENLGLKVGDYVAVAIRVKQEFSNGDNAFVLKDNDYSMILPVMQSGNNTYRPGRVAGYKVKTSDVDIESGTVGLISMVDPELPPLDGWTLLSKLNLKQDQKGNYLGVDLDLQLYSDYYKKSDGGIWISGSGQKLVKRETKEDNSSLVDSGKVYKDGQDQPIKDEKGQDIKIYKTDKNRLSNPKKSANVTKTQSLENLGNGGFRLDIDKLNNQDKGLLSLFRNQDVDLKLKAHQGQGTEEWPDFYLDENNKTIDLKDIISPKIKYPIENENKITYSWNYEDFSTENIEYDKVGSNSKPEDGAAKIKTIFKLLKKQGTADKWTEVTGETSDQAVQKINQTLKEDFQDQLKFQLSRTRSNGGGTDQDSNNIYQFSDLRNKDRIVLKIVAKEDDLYYVEAPRPLIINVNGLTEAAPGKEKLQHLRVQQSGLIDGQGSFKVLVSDPKNPDEDERTILKGWKFMVRVWAKDFDEEGKRKIKINWTDDQSSIKNLENGDKVEWKLVSEDGNPVKDAYYNTIALDHKTNPADGSITYNFAQVNYPHGNSTYDPVQSGIGAYPEDDQQYPETSGFVISGLKDKFEIFRISKTGLEKALSQLQPTYVGMNTQGTIHFDPKYFEQEYWVNTEGQIYTQAEKPSIYQDQAANEVIEISLIDFIKHVTFYTKDPVIVPFQNGFKFNGNDTSINNHLTNGDHLWAKFDMLDINDDHKTKTTVESGLENSVIVQLADVSGLKDIIDPMSPLWYVLMALAGIATLGTAAIIAFLISRHKKLKGKN